MSVQDIFNYRQVDERIGTAGQPTEAQLAAVAQAGFEAVVNLAARPTDAAPADEAGLVRSLGMTYHHIPVDWNDPKPSDFEDFERVMAELEGAKTLIHCAANFRVTAFYGLYALKHLGWSEAQAEALRQSIWEDSDYPVWERFIEDMKLRQGAAREESGVPSGIAPSTA